MSLGKKDISKNILSKAQLDMSISSQILNKFISVLKQNINHRIKISNFGSFSISITPKRIGRNPKTREVFDIHSRKKISFKTSNKVKSILN
jgi:integration host factor subunit alpha